MPHSTGTYYKSRPGHIRPKGKSKLGTAMSEVHRNIPSTVKRANVSGKRKEAMLRAIAFSKARKAGAKIPRKKWVSTSDGRMQV